MKQNIKKYKYHLFLKNSLWIGPILTLFYLLKTMNYAQIFIIASTFKIALAIFEVPTGAIADKYGYKRSVVLGLLIIGIGVALYPLGSAMIYFICCEVFMAIGFALVSGADESLFYNSLKKENKEKDYNKIMGQASQYKFLSQIIGAILASILFEINCSLPFMLSALLMFAGAILFSTFKEEEKIHNDSQNFKEYINHIKESGKYVLNHKKIRTVILFASIVGMTYGSIHLAYTPYFLDVGIRPIYFGLIYALFNVIALLSARYTHIFMKYTKPHTLMYLGALMFVSFLLLGVIHISVGILAISFMQVYRGMSGTIYGKYINKNTESERRATVLSFFSLVSTLFTAGFAIIIGIIMNNTNIFDTYKILALILGGLLIIMSIFLNKNLGNLKKNK